MTEALFEERIPIVDCDVHPMIEDIKDVLPYMPQAWRQHFEERGMRTYARARDRYNHPEKTQRVDATPPSGGPAGSDRDFTIATHLDPHEITCALLLPQQPYGVTAWGDAAAATIFLSANNDYLYEHWVDYDDRYAIAVTVSPHDPHAAAAEIRRHAGQPGVIGVQLLLLDRMMGDLSFDPIYEAACESDLPIVLHQSGSEGCYYASQSVAGGGPRSYGERHVVLTQVGSANVVDMIVNGAFERFPTMRLVLVEWGFSWLASLLDRMDTAWERDPAAAPWIKKRPSQYVFDHIKLTTQPLDELEKASEWSALWAMPGLDKFLLFSSDYPHYDTDDPTFIIRRIPKELRAAVCYGNAVETFGDGVLRATASGVAVSQASPAEEGR
jgi:predicted TIM-barrel fold metal-dependent hydrolase